MKQKFPGSALLAPVPAVLISCGDTQVKNALTAAWVGMVCTAPPMLSVSIRPERYSYPIIEKSGEFAVNLTTRKLVRATDYCGVRSGRDADKATVCGFTYQDGAEIKAPIIAECPVNLECKVREIQHLGSHDLILADIVCVQVDDKLIDANGRIALEKADLITYCHGQYFALGELLGSFGYSVKRPKKGGAKRFENNKKAHPERKKKI